MRKKETRQLIANNCVAVNPAPMKSPATTRTESPAPSEVFGHSSLASAGPQTGGESTCCERSTCTRNDEKTNKLFTITVRCGHIQHSSLGEAATNDSFLFKTFYPVQARHVFWTPEYTTKSFSWQEYKNRYLLLSCNERTRAPGLTQHDTHLLASKPPHRNKRINLQIGHPAVYRSPDLTRCRKKAVEAG